MTTMSIEEIVLLENLLHSNPDMTLTELRALRPFELAYLRRARKLPIKLINTIIDICKQDEKQNRDIVNAICERFRISERDAKKRLQEVNRINNYRLRQSEAMKLQKQVRE